MEGDDRDMFEESQEAGGNSQRGVDGEELLNLKLASTQEEMRLSIYTQRDYQRDVNLNKGDSDEEKETDDESNDGRSSSLGSGDDEEDKSGEDIEKMTSGLKEENKDMEVKIVKTDIEKDKVEKELDEADEWQEIIAKEGIKEGLRLKNKKLQNEVYEAKETLWNRVKRVEEKKKLLVEQQAELYCQNQKLKTDGMEEEEIVKVTTENLENQIEKMKGKVTQLEVNATRLLKRKGSDDKEVMLKIKTLSKLNDVDKNIAVFYTGVSIDTTQSKKVLDELQLVKNLSLIGCGDGSMKKVATEIKNMKLKGGREEVGVVIVDWGDLARAEDDDELKSEAGTLQTILKLVTNRGGSKFGKFMLILPPVNGLNERALQKFSKEVQDSYKPDVRVVALEGPTAGFKNDEAMSGYVLRRSLTEVSKWLGEGEESICRECGLLEHDGECPVVIESEAISTDD